MAVPKKRTSKSKKNIRKKNWKNQGVKQTKKGLSLLLLALNKKERFVKQSWVYTYYNKLNNFEKSGGYV